MTIYKELISGNNPYDIDTDQNDQSEVSQFSEGYSQVVQKKPSKLKCEIKIKIERKSKFIFGIILILIGIVDMLAPFFIQQKRIRENKRKLPNATFRKPEIAVLVVHFILHSSIILLGARTIYNSFKTESFIDFFFFGFFFFYSYIFEIIFGMLFTTDIGAKTNIDELEAILQRNPPANFAFIYSEDKVQTLRWNGDEYETAYETCYSKKGVIVPIKSSIFSSEYNFTDSLDLFFFDLKQDVRLSQRLINNLERIIHKIGACDDYASKVIKYYPKITLTYVVKNGKMPIGIKKASKCPSVLFGLGIIYELNCKDIPYIDFTQMVFGDSAPGVNYDDIFSTSQCHEYGHCNEDNMVPET